MVNPMGTGTLNAVEFSQPHWRVIAQGFDTEHWFTDGQAMGTGGINMPQPTRLPSGQNYFRFASSNTSRVNQLSGGWWIDFEAFNTLSQFASQHGYRLRDAARLFLALPYEWTKVDLLVTALLQEPLSAYTGYGKTADLNSGKQHTAAKSWSPLQHNRVRQLYIPGLYVKGRAEQIYEKAFLQPPKITSS